MKSIDPHFKKDFDRRLEAWISKQGIWFQLQHATSFSEVVKTLFDLSARLVIVLLLVLLGMWFYLRHQITTEGYRDKLNHALVEGTQAAGGEVVGVSRAKVNLMAANLRVAEVKLNGSEKSFFEERVDGGPAVSALGVVLSPLGVLDGIYTGWSGNALTIENLDLNLKSGAETDEAARECYQQMFKQYENLKIMEIDAAQANITWGYSEDTMGAIRGASLAAQYGREGWRIRATGGKFSYGFIKDADIESFLAICDDEGVHIAEAELRLGKGTIRFTANLSVEAKPKITGDISINHLSLENVLSPYHQKWIGGYISGEGKIGGNTYDGAGPEFDLNILLQRNDDIVLEGRFPLFSSLELVDTLNSYQRVKFGAGTFRLRKEGGQLMISNINVRAGILMYMKGDLLVVDRERDAVMEVLGDSGDDLLKGMESAEEKLKSEDSEDGFVSLADAIKAGEALEKKAREVLVLPGGQQKYITGNLEIGLKNTVFDRLAVLRDEFPMDDDKKHYLINLEVDSFMEQIGKSVADKIDAAQKASLETVVDPER